MIMLGKKLMFLYSFQKMILTKIKKNLYLKLINKLIKLTSLKKEKRFVKLKAQLLVKYFLD